MNELEICVKRQLEKEGYTVLRNGLPDFICLKNGEVSFVEVKSHFDKLRKNQIEAIDLLIKHGFDVEVRTITYSEARKNAKEVLEAQGKNATNKKVADDPDHLNMPRSTMHGINSNIFNNFREALEVMDEYFPVFEGRYKKHEKEVWARLRSIRTKLMRLRNE